MDLEFFGFLALGAAAGGFISGLAGFGTALFGLGIWLQIMPPLQAVSLVVAMSIISGLQGVWLVRASIMDKPHRLARFLIPALVGVPLGVAALSILQPNMLKLIVGTFLILYGGFFSFRSTLPKLERPTPVIDSGVGFLGGILGGAAGLSGALPTMWFALRPWSKAETRAVLQPFNLLVLSMTAVVFAFNGAYTTQTLTYIVMALPVTTLFAQIGILVFKRLSDEQFRRLLVGLMFVSGMILVTREFFG